MPLATKPTSSRSTSASGYVVLLRGINVGGKHKLAMSDLAAMLVEAGGLNVRTYIQSGNGTFTATTAVAKRLPRLLADKLADRLGFSVSVVLRSADDFRDVIASNPFLKAGADIGTLHVAFLARLPDRNRVAALDPHRSPGDAFTLHGREIYLYLPNGVARTRLTNAYFDATLATTCTVRNWRTVCKLHELTQSLA
jgi:uncharacterized protein (DUF1697 family)